MSGLKCGLLIALAGWCLVSTASATPVEPSRTPIEEAFEAAQWADLSLTAQALAKAAARNAAATPQLKSLIDDLLAARQAYDVLDQTANAARGGTSEAAKLRAKNLSDSADAARLRVETLSSRLTTEYPAYDSLVAPFPVALTQTQALLRPDEALVMIHPTPNGTYIFAIRAGLAHWYRTDATTAQLRPQVDALRFALDPGRDALRGSAADASGLPPEFTFSRQSAYNLYQQVFAPAYPFIKDAKVVYTVTSGPLSYLPLSVLVTAPPQGSDQDVKALRHTDWLIKSFALASLPSVNSLKFLRQSRNDAAPGRGFLGFGAPDLAETGQLEDLAPLPGAKRELLDMARLLGNDASKQVFTGPKATEASVRTTDLSGIRIIAFATHALRAGEREGLEEPALVLTASGMTGDSNNDGFLTATEAASLRLNADWVILSACNTASGRKKAGENGDEVLSGLARGFLASGARSLIVSHWRVSDTSAAKLTASAVRHYVGGQGRAQALQTAMLDMLDDSRDPTAAAPSNWAAMVVVGEAR